MIFRAGSLLLIAGLAASCAPAADEEAAAEPAAEMSADEAALEQLRADYVTHYNLHHADMVAALFTDSAVFLAADNTMQEGREAIQAALAEDFAGSPELNLATGGTMVMGDNAVARGTYTATTTPEGGAPMTMTGHYLTVFFREAGAWKIGLVATNFDSAPPEGFPFGEMPGEPPPENGTMGALLTEYTTHFNLGHADMAAAVFTEDAVMAFNGRPEAVGRAAIQATLESRMAAGNPQVEMHDVATIPMGEGWAVDGGWYRINATTEAGATVTEGVFLTLCQQQPDGSWKVHWGVSNGRTLPAG
jgi:uncharacterized protein (TIGR02246 family)